MSKFRQWLLAKLSELNILSSIIHSIVSITGVRKQGFDRGKFIIYKEILGKLGGIRKRNRNLLD